MLYARLWIQKVLGILLVIGMGMCDNPSFMASSLLFIRIWCRWLYLSSNYFHSLELLVQLPLAPHCHLGLDAIMCAHSKGQLKRHQFTGQAHVMTTREESDDSLTSWPHVQPVLHLWTSIDQSKQVLLWPLSVCDSQLPSTLHIYSAIMNLVQESMTSMVVVRSCYKDDPGTGVAC